MVDEEWDKLQKDVWTKAAKDSVITTHPDTYLDDLETRELLKFGKGKVLNAGCGGGYETHVMRKNGFDAHGFDITPAMVDIAKKEYGDFFFVADVLKLGTLNRKYDTLTTKRTIINLQEEDHERAYAEMCKVANRIILIEGCKEGYAALNKLRKKFGLDEIKVVPFNKSIDCERTEKFFKSQDFRLMHRGFFNTYYQLTRIYYPLVTMGVRYNTEFQRAAKELQKVHNIHTLCSPHVIYVFDKIPKND